MPKYWVKNYFIHGRFPKVGQKQKTERKRRKKKKERKTERWGILHPWRAFEKSSPEISLLSFLQISTLNKNNHNVIIFDVWVLIFVPMYVSFFYIKS